MSDATLQLNEDPDDDITLTEIVQRSVTALQIDEHCAMSAEEFLGADLHAEVCSDMSDTDILEIVKGTHSSKQNYDDESDDADEDIQPKPTLKEARSALSVLLRFTEAENKLDETDVDLITKLRKRIDQTATSYAKQSELTEFFSRT